MVDPNKLPLIPNCHNCAHFEEDECEIMGNKSSYDFDKCVNHEWDYNHVDIPCAFCKSRKGKHIRGSVCDNHCGLWPINSGHPLAPCNGCEPEYDEEGNIAENEWDACLLACEAEERALEEGGRCWAYISWLRGMKGVN